MTWMIDLLIDQLIETNPDKSMRVKTMTAPWKRLSIP